jgi:hypothetical protein
MSQRQKPRPSKPTPLNRTPDGQPACVHGVAIVSLLMGDLFRCPQCRADVAAIVKREEARIETEARR